MTPDGHFNGWGIHYFDNLIMIGWRNNSQWHGNYLCIDARYGTVDPSSGWYEWNAKVGEL